MSRHDWELKPEGLHPARGIAHGRSGELLTTELSDYLSSPRQTAGRAISKAVSHLRGDRILTLATQATIVSFNLLASVLIVRDLGPSDTGSQATIARSAAILLSVVCMSYPHGLAQVASVGDSQQLRASWAGALILAIPQGIVSASVLIVIYGFVIDLPNTQARTLAIFYGLTLGLQLVTTAGQHILRGSHDYVGFNANRFVQAASWGLLCSILFAADYISLVTVGIAWLLSQVIALGLVLRRMARHGISPDRPSRIRGPLSFGLRAHVGVVGRDVAPYIDQVIVAALLGTVALGLYVPASAFSGLVLIVGIAMSMVIQPRLVSAPAENRIRLTLVLVAQAAGASTVMGAICAATAEWIVPLAYGEVYESSGQLGAVLSAAVILDSTTLAIVSALMGLGRPGRASLVQAIGTLAVLSSMTLLVSDKGIAAVPQAMFLAYGFTILVATGLLVLSLAAIRRERQYQ